MIDKKFFFAAVKEKHLFGALSTDQVTGMEAVIDQWDKSGYTDLRWLAYMYATDYHETARRMMPIEEFGKGKGRPYGSKIKRSGLHYTTPDFIYYGRGLVQLTWYENYELMGRLLGVDLLNHPELACTLAVAVPVLFEGMTKGSSSFGDFTGRCLEMFFTPTIEDPVGARTIINGKDQAATIAKYYYLFKECLKVQ